MKTATATNMQRSERGQVTKRLILSTAMKIASTHGIEGVTIGELAKKIGMSKSGLFAHFENKDNLQLEILKMASDHFVENVMKPAFLKPRGLPRIEALFESWMNYLDDNSTLPGGSIFVAASFELDDRPGILKDFVQITQEQLILNIEKAVQLAIDEGHFKKTTNKKDFAWKMYSFVLGYHHYKRMLQNPGAKNFIQQAMKELIDLNRFSK
jgi:AcrR family transcriptional regulator